MIQKLIVNGKLLAAYEVENDTIFMKVFITTPKCSLGETEESYIHVICAAHGKWFNKVAYLNITEKDLK